MFYTIFGILGSFIFLMCASIILAMLLRDTVNNTITTHSSSKIEKGRKVSLKRKLDISIGTALLILGWYLFITSAPIKILAICKEVL